MSSEIKLTLNEVSAYLNPESALDEKPKVRRIDGHRYIFSGKESKGCKLDDLASGLLLKISNSTDPEEKNEIIHYARKLTEIYKKTDKWYSVPNKGRSQLEEKLKENPIKILEANLDVATNILTAKPQTRDVISHKPGNFRTHRYILDKQNDSYYQLDQMAKVLLEAFEKGNSTEPIKLAASNLLEIYNNTDQKGTFSIQNPFRKKLSNAVIEFKKNLQATSPTSESRPIKPIVQGPLVSSITNKSPSSIDEKRLALYKVEAEAEFFQPRTEDELNAGFAPLTPPLDIQNVRVNTEHSRVQEDEIDSLLIEQMKAANMQGSKEANGKFTTTELDQETHSTAIVASSNLPQKLDSCKNHEDQQVIIENFIKDFISGRISPTPMKGSEHCKVHEADVGIAWSEGNRTSMEDEHLAIPFDIMIKGEKHKGSLFGVFDGHRGNLAAAYVKEFLPAMLKARLEQENEDGISSTGITNALRLAMVDLHEEFYFACKDLEDNAWEDGGLESNTEPLNAGTTAVIMLRLDDKDIYLANTGDTRALKVAPDGSTSQVTEDANAADLKEQIRAKGGTVEDMNGVFKINGTLSVGKAIGDRQEAGIIPLPTITRISGDQITKDTFIVLSCDGPFEAVTHKGDDENYKVASSLQIGDAVFTHRKHSKERSAEQIVSDSIKGGSQDNITLMIIGDLSPSSEVRPLEQ